jgi:sulfatase modifying factor 1
MPVDSRKLVGGGKTVHKPTIPLLILVLIAVAQPHLPIKRPYIEKTNLIDGSTMVLIPAATFTMGGPNDNGYDAEDEKPSRVHLSSYYIGKYDVTNDQFTQFVSVSRYKASGPWQTYSKKWGGNAPVVEISWKDARAYCDWAKLRLPSEAEWEHAARGEQGFSYPWGDKWDSSRCCCSHKSRADAGRPSPVSDFPNGASPFGCFQMTGNVSQICSSKDKPYPYNPQDGREDLTGPGYRCLRGGRWIIPEIYSVFFLATGRDLIKPDSYSYDVGFRVACDSK